MVRVYRSIDAEMETARLGEGGLILMESITPCLTKFHMIGLLVSQSA
jgi:hypothetical protein